MYTKQAIYLLHPLHDKFGKHIILILIVFTTFDPFLKVSTSTCSESASNFLILIVRQIFQNV